jgi:hypothetical protein
MSMMREEMDGIKRKPGKGRWDDLYYAFTGIVRTGTAAFFTTLPATFPKS